MTSFFIYVLGQNCPLKFSICYVSDQAKFTTYNSNCDLKFKRPSGVWPPRTNSVWGRATLLFSPTLALLVSLPSLSSAWFLLSLESHDHG